MNVAILRARLREAFSKVKEEQEKLYKTIDTFKADMDAVKQDYVGKDKLNLLKLKIGEINETLKKIWDLEQDIKSLDEKTVNKTYFNQQLEIINEDMDDLKQGLATLNKEYVSEFQVKELVDGINKEFNDIKEKVTAMKSIKDTITSRELRKRTDELHKRMDDNTKLLRKTEEELRHSGKKNEESLQEKYKKDSDELRKKVVAQDDSIESIRRSTVERKDFHRYVKQLEDENHVMKNELKDLKAELREIDRLRIAIKRIEQGKPAGLPGLVMKRTVVTETSKTASPKFKVSEEVAESNSNHKGTKVFANVLIVLAFLSLMASVAMYFWMPDYYLYPTMAAIGLFLVGIIMRIAVVVKGK